jgi:hypothetical protein
MEWAIRRWQRTLSTVNALLRGANCAAQTGFNSADLSLPIRYPATLLGGVDYKFPVIHKAML